MNSGKVAIVIPVLGPDSHFMPYCHSLLEHGADRIIIVDDGSPDKTNFDYSGWEDSYAEKIVLLKHCINLGKGRALKDAMNHFMNMEDVSDFCGIITADSDGQHTVDDVCRLKETLQQDQDRLILGIRDFDHNKIPVKSAFGNRTTRRVFHLLHGVKLKDTQTGLRAVPTKLIPLYVGLYGERFEYEMNMLIHSARNHIGITEIPIQTIYLHNNKGTHFSPLHESFAIYKLIFGTFFRYILSSVSSFAVDIVFFRLVLGLAQALPLTQTGRIFTATIAARIISSLYNYLVNRNIVFRSSGNAVTSLIGYYALCVVQMLLSASLVALLVHGVQFSETVAKIIVDSFLFLLSYYVQRKYIFREVTS